MRASLSAPPGFAKPRGRRSRTSTASRSAARGRKLASYQVNSIDDGRREAGSGANRNRSSAGEPCGTEATVPRTVRSRPSSTGSSRSASRACACQQQKAKPATSPHAIGNRRCMASAANADAASKTCAGSGSRGWMRTSAQPVTNADTTGHTARISLPGDDERARSRSAGRCAFAPGQRRFGPGFRCRPAARPATSARAACAQQSPSNASPAPGSYRAHD